MFDDTLVGLEIGKRTTKIAAGSYKLGKFSLKGCHIVETPEGAFLPDDSLNVEVAAPFMTNLMKDRRIKKNNFHIGINTSKAILRERVLPKAKLEELLEISKFEIEQFLPYSMNDFVVDYRVLEVGTEEGSDGLRALIAAVPRDIIDSYMDVSKKSGFKIRSISIYSECLSRSMKTCNSYPDDNILLVDIGSHLARLTIFRGNSYFASFNSDLGGDAATRRLAEENQLNFEEAEEKKIARGLAMTQDLFDKNSLSGFDFDHSLLMNSYCNELGSEISRVVNFFRTRKFSGIIHRVVLIGGGSEIKGLDTYLQGILGVDVEYFKNTESQILYGKDFNVPIEDIGKILPAMGAILRG